MITKKCQQCGKNFQVYPYRKNAKFCSQVCCGNWKSENTTGVNNPHYKEKIIKKCKNCGKTFTTFPSTSNRKFCSMVCWKDFIKVKAIKCKYCGKTFQPPEKGRKFCSHECYEKWETGQTYHYKSPVKKVCPVCGKVFFVAPYKAEKICYCSRKCLGEWRAENIRGKNHPCYILGLDRKYPLEFDSHLKEQIRFRDHYKCQVCGCPQIENRRALDVHHKDYDKKNCDWDNLISLCQSCHVRTNSNRKYWKTYFKGVLDEDLCT